MKFKIVIIYFRQHVKNVLKVTTVTDQFKIIPSALMEYKILHHVNLEITVQTEPNLPRNMAALMEHTLISTISRVLLNVPSALVANTVDRKDYQPHLVTVLVDTTAPWDHQQRHLLMEQQATSVIRELIVQQDLMPPVSVLQGLITQ